MDVAVVFSSVINFGAVMLFILSLSAMMGIIYWTSTRTLRLDIVRRWPYATVRYVSVFGMTSTLGCAMALSIGGVMFYIDHGGTVDIARLIEWAGSIGVKVSEWLGGDSTVCFASYHPVK